MWLSSSMVIASYFLKFLLIVSLKVMMSEGDPYLFSELRLSILNTSHCSKADQLNLCALGDRSMKFGM